MAQSTVAGHFAMNTTTTVQQHHAHSNNYNKSSCQLQTVTESPVITNYMTVCVFLHVSSDMSQLLQCISDTYRHRHGTNFIIFRHQSAVESW
jgi:hypothetical protein